MSQRGGLGYGSGKIWIFITLGYREIDLKFTNEVLGYKHSALKTQCLLQYKNTIHLEPDLHIHLSNPATFILYKLNQKDNLSPAFRKAFTNEIFLVIIRSVIIHFSFLSFFTY